MMAPRGTDPRLLDDPRRTSKTRRQAYEERMDAKSEARAELAAEREAGLWRDDEGFEVNRPADDNESGTDD
jgi:GTP-binding protein